MKRFIPACLLPAFILFFLLSAGCSSDRIVDPPVSGTVTLLTRSVTETAAAHRLLVFGFDMDNSCKLNHSFTSGSAVALTEGNYRFVTLTETACFELPAAGTTAGLALDLPLPLKESVALEPILIKEATRVALPQTSYIAVLQPATCLLRLTLTDAPENLTLTLQNMAAGLSLTGTYDTAATKAYQLKAGDNLCLPTVGKAIVQFAETDGKTGTLKLGVPLEAGYTYQAALKWHAEGLTLTSKVEMWNTGTSTEGNAE